MKQEEPRSELQGICNSLDVMKILGIYPYIFICFYKEEDPYRSIAFIRCSERFGFPNPQKSLPYRLSAATTDRFCNWSTNATITLGAGVLKMQFWKFAIKYTKCHLSQKSCYLCNQDCQMPCGSNFHLNSELTDFFQSASSLLVLLSWTLEQKFHDNGAFANYVFQYNGSGGFIFYSFRSSRALFSHAWNIFSFRIYLFYWLNIHDKKEPSRRQNKLSTLCFIFMMKCRYPIKRQILPLKCWIERHLKKNLTD